MSALKAFRWQQLGSASLVLTHRQLVFLAQAIAIAISRPFLVWSTMHVKKLQVGQPKPCPVAATPSNGK